MNALFGEAVGYVEGGEAGCVGACGECSIGAFVTDPNNSYYEYAPLLDCPLVCWPYSWSAVIDLPQNTNGSGSATANANVGLSKTVPALAGGLFNVTSVGLVNRISGGSGDIAIGTPYCQVVRINENFLGNDDSAYAVDGTLGVPGPYTVSVEVVAISTPSLRLSYRFNGVEMVTASDPLNLGPTAGFLSVYRRAEDFGLGDPPGAISNIFASGCPALVPEEQVSTLDVDEPQPELAGAYVP